MRTMILVVALAAAVSGCVDPDAARHVLADDGYKDIAFGKGSGFFAFMAGCDRRYPFRTPFEASLTGRRVSGVVCSGATDRAPQVRRYD